MRSSARAGMIIAIAVVATSAGHAALRPGTATRGDLHHSSVAATSALVWQKGSEVRPVIGNGQCGGDATPADPATYTLPLRRDTNGREEPMSSACYRNQYMPQEDGHDFFLRLGSHYTFVFETVVYLNKNYVYDGGHEADLPGLVWQTHGEAGIGHGADPCDSLVIQNTAFVNGNSDDLHVTKPYRNVPPGGQPVWNFHTCDKGDYSDYLPPAYNSPDVIAEGQHDRWQIDIVAQVVGHAPAGRIVVHRNGAVVYDAPSSVCAGDQPLCWWNFGPYMFHWPTSHKPPSFNADGVTVQFKNLRLYKS